MEPIFNSVASYSMYLKLETIIHTSMYSVFTIPCMNGEHVTDQIKVIELNKQFIKRVLYQCY